MRPITLAWIAVSALAVIVGVTSPTFAETIVFVDGTRMEVKKHEVKGAMVVLTGMDGKLRSVPSAFVNFEATAKANRSATVASDSSAPKSAPSKSAPPEPRPVTPAVEPARTTSSSAASPPVTPAGSRPSVAEAPPPQPTPPAPAPPPGRREPSAQRVGGGAPTQQEETVGDVPAPPKPLPSSYPSTEIGGAQSWSDEELRVSLVIPSSAWRVREAPASFDVAVQFDKPSGEARATLALIRRPMRNYNAFQKALIEIQNSAAGAPGFRPLLSKRQVIGPYTAYEIRFLKDSGGRTTFNRLVSFYSKDMIYTLSMSCPEARLAETDPDFEAFVLGLQIKKSRDEVVPKGAPDT